MRRSRPARSHWAATLAAVVVAGLTLAACGSGPPKAATPLPAPSMAGTIAFERVVEPHVDSDIYVVNTSGTGLKRLTDDPGWEEHPAWSPDGRKIVWLVVPRGGGNDPKIWVMNADGSGKVQLTKGSVGGDQPTWSPDGKRIAFAGASGSSGICVINADGTGLRRVVLSDAEHPAWAPDGEILYLGSAENAPVNFDVFAVKPDGSDLVQLTKGRDVKDFGLSPDGQRLAIYDVPGDRVVIVPVRGGGTAVTLLDGVSDYVAERCTPLNAYIALTWSPDGKALALATSDTCGLKGSRVYVVNADGTGLSAVPGVDAAMEPAWRPE